WTREADDLWELKWDDGTTMLVTSEHPLWTSRGWVPVHATVSGRTICGGLPLLREGIHGRLEKSEKLHEGVWHQDRAVLSVREDGDQESLSSPAGDRLQCRVPEGSPEKIRDGRRTGH